MADVEYNIKFNVDASDAADGFDEVREAANESFQKLLKMFDELNKATEEFNKIDLNALSDDQELLDSAAAMSELANKTREVQGAFAEWQNTISQLDSDTDVAVINQMYDSFSELGHPLTDAEDSITAMIEKLKELNHETESFYDDEDGAPLLDEAELQKSLEIIEDGYAEIGASTMNVIEAEERQRAAFQAAYEEYARAQEKEEAAAEALAKRAQKETAAKEAKEQAEAAKAAAKHQEEVKKKIEATINSAKKLANTMKSVGSAILSAAKKAGKLALSLAKGPSLGSGMLKKALGVAGIVGIGALFKQASSAANDLTDSVGMVNAAFGENSKSMHDWADNQAIYYNVSRLSAEKYFGELGEYLKNANVDADAAATMAKNMVAKAGEVGRAYAGMSSDQAMNIMQNVLAGGRVKQQGSKIGLKLDDDAYQAELLAEGINAVYKDLSASEQMIIRYNTVMRQLGDTTGSTADGFMSWEGAVANLTANVKDALSSFGLIIQHYLLPVVQLLNTVMAAVADALRGLLGTLGIDLPQASTAAAEAVEGVGEAATGAGKDAEVGLAGFDKLNNLSESKGGGAGGLDSKAVSGTIKPIDQLTDKLGEAKTKLQELIDKIKKLDYKALGKKIAKLFNNGVNKLKTWLKKLEQFDVGTKLGNLFNGFFEDFDTEALGDLVGTAFGNLQTTITNFLTTLDAENIGEKIADFIIGFDLPTNLGKLGTNVGFLISKIAETINGMLGGEKGDEVRRNIKEGIKNFLSNAIENIKPEELGQAIGNIANTLASALTGAAEGIDGLGGKLAEALNSAIETGGIKNLAKGIADFVLAASKEIGEFLTSADLLDCAKEILSGIKDAIVENPEGAEFLGGAIAAVLATKAVLNKITSAASTFFAANPVAIPLTILIAGLSFLWSEKAKQDATLEGIKESSSEYMAKESTIDLKYIPAIEKDEAKFRSDLETMITYYRSIMKDYTLIGEDEKDYAIGGVSIVQWLFGDLDEAQASQYIKDKLPLIEMDLQKLVDDGVDESEVDVAMSIIKKIKSQDTLTDNDMLELQQLAADLGSEIITIYGNGIATADNQEIAKSMETIIDPIKNALTFAGDAVESAPKLADEVDDLSKSLSSDAFQSKNTSKILDLLDNMGSDSDTAQQKMDKLNNLLSPFITNITNLSKACGELDSKLPPTTEKLSNFLDLYEKISSQHWDGKLIDNGGLQSNLDIAVGKVQKAAKDIDTAIADATNLRNFEATLSSTQTIKVDSSGTMNFKFDVTTKPDKDAFNSWQEKYTKANKALNG